jgi:hypothetical protein
MWSKYVVNPFEWDNPGELRNKQGALEDAQTRAINNPGESFTVYRAQTYPETGGMDLIPVITYWFDEKLQYEKGQ